MEVQWKVEYILHMIRLSFFHSFNKILFIIYLWHTPFKVWRMLHEEDGWSPCCHGACILEWIVCETFWYLQTVIGSISILGSELSREWENVKLSHLRRVRSGYIRHNKERADYNVNKAVSATRTEHKERFDPCQAGPCLDDSEDLDGWYSKSHPVYDTTDLPSPCKSIILACLAKNRAKCLDNSWALFQNHNWPDLYHLRYGPNENRQMFIRWSDPKTNF